MTNARNQIKDEDPFQSKDKFIFSRVTNLSGQAKIKEPNRKKWSVIHLCVADLAKCNSFVIFQKYSRKPLKISFLGHYESTKSRDSFLGDIIK